MPRTTIEGLAAAAQARARLKAQAAPKPITTPQRHDLAEVTVSYGGAGRDKRNEQRETRALTRVERMHADGMLDFAEFQTAGVLRNRFLNELGSSEGVSAYDRAPRDPGWQKADKRAQAILTRNRTNRSRLSDLLFAMAGTTDESGDRVFDRQLALILVRASIEAVDPVQLGAIGAERSPYKAEKQRQAAGSSIIREALRRGAAHLGYLRLPAFDPAWSWRVTTEVAR
jgi:hypothetical protein